MTRQRTPPQKRMIYALAVICIYGHVWTNTSEIGCMVSSDGCEKCIKIHFNQ